MTSHQHHWHFHKDKKKPETLIFVLILIELMNDVDARFGYRLLKSAQHLALLFPCQSAVHTSCQCHEFSIDPLAYSTGCFRAVPLPHLSGSATADHQRTRIQLLVN